jgi:putative protease
MRAKATNFSVEQLPEIVSFCKDHRVKTYLTLNTIVFEEELSELEEIIIAAKQNEVDRIICSDLAVADLCYKHEFPFCISTQSSISNSLAADVYKRMGAVRIVMARECSLEEIKKIRAKTDLEIEAFVHGAMCIAVSGRCFMSHHLFNKSANRGECVQPCRREFEVYDSAIGKSLVIGKDYIMSPQDLCTIEFVDQLIEAGIDSFKIEGRKRAPEYVAKAVSVYRQAIDLYYENKLTKEKKKVLLTELEKVYNRGFSSGFYFDVPSSNAYAGVEGSKAKTRKVYVAKVLNYYKDIEVAHILMESGEIKIGNNLLIMGETTGLLDIHLAKMSVNDKDNVSAKRGDEITLKMPTLVRRNDKVYLIEHIK